MHLDTSTAVDLLLAGKIPQASRAASPGSSGLGHSSFTLPLLHPAMPRGKAKRCFIFFPLQAETRIQGPEGTIYVSPEDDSDRYRTSRISGLMGSGTNPLGLPSYRGSSGGGQSQQGGARAPVPAAQEPSTSSSAPPAFLYRQVSRGANPPSDGPSAPPPADSPMARLESNWRSSTGGSRSRELSDSLLLGESLLGGSSGLAAEQPGAAAAAARREETKASPGRCTSFVVLRLTGADPPAGPRHPGLPVRP